MCNEVEYLHTLIIQLTWNLRIYYNSMSTLKLTELNFLQSLYKKLKIQNSCNGCKIIIRIKYSISETVDEKS